MSAREKYITEKEVRDLTGRALSTLRNDRFLGRGFPYVKIRAHAKLSSGAICLCIFCVK